MKYGCQQKGYYVIKKSPVGAQTHRYEPKKNKIQLKWTPLISYYNAKRKKERNDGSNAFIYPIQ